jgi:hypothetical protein
VDGIDLVSVSTIGWSVGISSGGRDVIASHLA